MMMASISSMGVSAVTITYSVGGYSLQCGASKTTDNGLFISSAVTDQSVTVNVSGKAKYYYNNKYITTGNGNSGKGSNYSCYKQKKAVHGFLWIHSIWSIQKSNIFLVQYGKHLKYFN